MYDIRLKLLSDILPFIKNEGISRRLSTFSISGHISVSTETNARGFKLSRERVMKRSMSHG
jgi:hypothetical protein